MLAELCRRRKSGRRPRATYEVRPPGTAGPQEEHASPAPDRGPSPPTFAEHAGSGVPAAPPRRSRSELPCPAASSPRDARGQLELYLPLLSPSRSTLGVPKARLTRAENTALAPAAPRPGSACDGPEVTRSVPAYSRPALRRLLGGGNPGDRAHSGECKCHPVWRLGAS